MMNKFLNLVSILSCLVLLSLNAYAVDLPENCPDDMAKILKRGALIVGIYYKDKPPFVMTGKSGELYGFDIDLAKDIAQKLGVGIEFNNEATSYQELHDFAARGKVDVVICKFSRTYHRAKNLKFTTPYLTLKRAMLVNKMYAAKHGITEYPMDFLKENNVKIGVREKTSYVEFARNTFPKARIVEGKWEQLIKDLQANRIQALVRDEYVIRTLLRNNPEKALYFSVYLLKDQKDYIAMAVPQDSTQLLYWLNMYLDTKALNKDVADLINEYPELLKGK
jgi:polar amino acid transport system substrate-binding protein